MTTKATELLNDVLAQFGHQQVFELEPKLNALIAYIEELERKAQAYDALPALVTYLLPKDPETYGN